MNRRILYIVAFVVFIPIVVWYASGFSGVPEVTFQEAGVIADSATSTIKVLVQGRLALDHEVKEGSGGMVFYLEDGSGEVQRVVYDGTEEVTTKELDNALASRKPVEVAGHMCSDGQGARFHAKNIYLD